MSMRWRAAPAGLVWFFFLLGLPGPARGQEKEVHDTPKRYRELMKDPRIRAVLKGEKLPPPGTGRKRTGPADLQETREPSQGAGKKRKKGEERGKEEKKEARLQVPPRLRLPPPSMPKPLYRRGDGPPRTGWTGPGEEPAGPTPAPLGDDSPWPWNPSLVGGSPARTAKGKEPPREEGTPPVPGVSREGKSSPARPASNPPAFHGLFGEEDQPGLFLGVEEPGGETSREDTAKAGHETKGKAEVPAPPAVEIPPGPAGGEQEDKEYAGRKYEGNENDDHEMAGRERAAPPPAGGGGPSATPAGRAAAPLPRPSPVGGGEVVPEKGSAPRIEAEEARKDLDRMFLALGGLKAFRALGGLHATIRITAYDRMGAEVFARSAEQETLTGSAGGDRIRFTQGPTLGRRGDAFWAFFQGVERPDMVPLAAQELRVLSFLLRFPFCLADRGRFDPLSAKRMRRGGNELIEVALKGRGGEVTLYLEPTTCIPREILYTPPGGKPIRILLSDWRNLQGVVLPSRKAVLSSDGRRVSLEIRVIQVLGGFRWGPGHFLPGAGTSGRTP